MKSRKPHLYRAHQTQHTHSLPKCYECIKVLKIVKVNCEKDYLIAVKSEFNKIFGFLP